MEKSPQRNIRDLLVYSLDQYRFISIITMMTLSGILFSCSKVVYITQQGYGQLKIQWTAKPIDEVLKDPKVQSEVKEKLKSIIKYKKYFYQYFSKEPSSIYSEVTFLKDKAVTHLVISSYYNELKPYKEWFPFVGEFPYIGFFNKENAKNYAEDKESEGYFTYIRPVYAYSSLGYFEDKILSSFFQYNQYDLADLIFHELFHTIFFVKDNVDLNENLANYFGKELMYEYFKLNEKEKEKILKEENKRKEIRFRLVALIKKYDKKLKKQDVKSKEESEIFLKNFLEEKFFPEVKKTCERLEVKNCYPLKEKWNNASFAAYMTYEKKINFIETLRKERNFSLKDLFTYLETEYQIFKESDSKQNFSKFLEEKHETNSIHQ